MTTIFQAPMNWTTDGYGQPLCPVEHKTRTWDEDTDEVRWAIQPCGEPVDLIVTCLIPLQIGIELSPLACGVDANSSVWEVKCARGHVLAVSDSEDGGAEAFHWDTVFP